MNMQKLAHLRVVSDGVMGSQTHIFYVSREGIETEISDVITGMKFSGGLGMSEVNSVTFIKVKYDVAARALA